MEINKSPSKDIKTVNGVFSQEFVMDLGELAGFLRKLADQVESGDDLKIKTDEWVLPFPQRSFAKVDIDLEDDELEIEIEFKRRTGKLDVEKKTPIQENKESPEDYTI